MLTPWEAEYHSCPGDVAQADSQGSIHQVLVYRLDRMGILIIGKQKLIQSQCETLWSQATCQACCCPLTHLHEEVNAALK